MHFFLLYFISAKSGLEEPWSQLEVMSENHRGGTKAQGHLVLIKFYHTFDLGIAAMMLPLIGK